MVVPIFWWNDQPHFFASAFYRSMWEGFIRCCMMMYWPPHRTLFHGLSRGRTSLDRVVKAVIPPACLLDGLVFTLTCNSNRTTVRKWQKFLTKKVLFVFIDKPAKKKRRVNWQLHIYILSFHIIFLLVINLQIIRFLSFCYQNCYDLLWEKIVLVIEKNFWNSRLKAEKLQNFWDH